MHKLLKGIVLVSLLGSFHIASASTYVSGTITGDVTWVKADGPYIVDTLYIPDGASLTIEPGTIVKLGQPSCNCYTNISVSGRLTAGMPGAAERVVITSINDDIGGDTNGTTTAPLPGDWRQISVGAHGVLELYATDVRYGGAASALGIYFNPDLVRQINNMGTVVMDDVDIGYGYNMNYEQGSGGTTTIRHSRIHDATTGLSFLGGTTTVEDNIFTTTATAIRYPINDLIFTHQNNSGVGGIVLSGTPTHDITLTPDTMPYIIGGMNVPQGVTLTVLPGTIIKVPSGAYGLSVLGILVMGSASSTDKVFVTAISDDTVGGDTNGDGPASVPYSGNWGTIRIGSGGIGNITNTTIRYGGAYIYDYWGHLSTSPVLENGGGTLSLSLSTVSDGKEWLLSSSGTTTVSQSELTRGMYGVSVQNGNTIIHNSSIHDNTQYGVLSESVNTAIIDATENWWGSALGPTYILNPSGTGDRVSTYVDYVPWLGQEPSTTTATTTCTTDCNSNVLFLPGLEASRLYRSTRTGETGTEKELWEPKSNTDVEDLFLDTNGKQPSPWQSTSQIYTKDVIDEAYINNAGPNVYKSFLATLDGMKNIDHTIADYSAVPYDWRLSLEDILAGGIKTGDHISYISTSSDPYIMSELRRLVASSRNGKVTIVAHSNGGLVAKLLLKQLADNNDPLLAHVDKLILVASPQIGTPAAVGALLFGTDQGIPSFAPVLLSPATARTFAENSPGANNLLPSSAYFDVVHDSAHPLISFDGSPELSAYRSLYGQVVGNSMELHDFLLGYDGRLKPDANDISKPNVLNSSIVNAAALTHSDIDNWTPPSTMNVYEIAGWGNETLAGFKFWMEPNFNGLGAHLTYTPDMVEDGDGTVVVPSALATASSSNVERLWVDLRKYNGAGLFGLKNINRDHKDILEVADLLNFLKDAFGDKDVSDLSRFTYISTATPTSPSEPHRLHYILHSPLSLDLYDNLGNHTGISTTTGMIESSIPGAYYRTFGEVKYISAPADAPFHLVLNGQASGIFTLEVSEMKGDTTIASTTFLSIPTSTSTKATMNFTDGTIANASDLTVDENGDGTIDFALAPKLGEIVVLPPSDVTPPEAIITFATSTQVLVVSGIDASSSPVMIHTTATGTMVTDQSGNTLLVPFIHYNTTKHHILLSFNALVYNGSTTTIATTTLKYQWEKNKKGKYVMFSSLITTGAITTEARYRPKENITVVTTRRRDGDEHKVDDEENSEQSSNQRLSGMVILRLETNEGNVGVNY